MVFNVYTKNNTLILVCRLLKTIWLFFDVVPLYRLGAMQK